MKESTLSWETDNLGVLQVVLSPTSLATMWKPLTITDLDHEGKALDWCFQLCTAVAWGLLENAGAWALPQTNWFRMSGAETRHQYSFERFSGNSDVKPGLRTTRREDLENFRNPHVPLKRVQDMETSLFFPASLSLFPFLLFKPSISFFQSSGTKYAFWVLLVGRLPNHRYPQKALSRCFPISQISNKAIKTEATRVKSQEFRKDNPEF